MHIEDRYLHQRSSSQESFDQILEGSSAFEYKGRWDTSKHCLDNIIKKPKDFPPGQMEFHFMHLQFTCERCPFHTFSVEGPALK